jgi:hypothetical protein
VATTYSAQAEEEKKKYNQIYDKQIEQINLNSDANIKNLNSTYDDQQRAIEVQKLVNERKVAESMANLGLTDSGLNRTQQTAVQLSAANARYQLDRQKQAAIDSYNLDRSNQIAQIEQNRLATDIEIDNNYRQLEESNKKAYAEALAKAQEEASYVIGKNSYTLNRGNVNGSLTNSNVGVVYGDDKTTYTDYTSGESRTFARTANPYTGTDNKKAVEKYDAFDNGYQPKGVEGVGAFDTTNKGYVIKAGDYYWMDDNSRQNVFKITKNGKSTYWVWDGGSNEYFQVKLNKNGKWEEVK